jgi:hypothetical protein
MRPNKREARTMPRAMVDGTSVGLKLMSEVERLRAENAALKRNAAEAVEIITQSEMRCNHIADDGSDDCGNIDDCVYHALRACFEGRSSDANQQQEALKRDAACFAALYEMSELVSDPDFGYSEWVISIPDASNSDDPIKDRERFRKAIEAQK